MNSNLNTIKSYCRSSLQMKLFNSLLKSFADEDPHLNYLESKIETNQDIVNDIKDQINEENQYLNGLKNRLADASIELSESKQNLTDYKRNLKNNTIMNTELRKSFVELKKVCKTANQRKAYNKLVKSFSDEDPTPEQKGIIEYLKGWVEEHPGEAKYLAELGAKWGPDKLLEGLNYDADDHDTFAHMKISSSKLKEGIRLLEKLEDDIRKCQKSDKEVDWAKLNPYFVLTTNGFTQEEAEEVVHVF